MGEHGDGSFAACGRDAGLKTGAPGLNGVALSSSGVPAMGERSDGSFAACGRDAGLKTGAPGLNGVSLSS